MLCTVSTVEDKPALLLSLVFAMVWCWLEQQTQEQYVQVVVLTLYKMECVKTLNRCMMKCDLTSVSG